MMESLRSFLGREHLLLQKNGRSMKQTITRTKEQTRRSHPARSHLFIMGALVVSLFFIVIVPPPHQEVDQRAQVTSGVVPTWSPIGDCNTIHPCPSIAPQPTSAPAGMPPSTNPQRSGASSSEPSGQALPTDNVAGWKLLFADDFSGTVPLGAFRNCSSTQTPQQARCAGLQSYGSYYK